MLRRPPEYQTYNRSNIKWRLFGGHEVGLKKGVKAEKEREQRKTERGEKERREKSQPGTPRERREWGQRGREREKV